jgi:hypothetical protein
VVKPRSKINVGPAFSPGSCAEGSSSERAPML